jgi:ABC-2 type transport system permease protein
MTIFAPNYSPPPPTLEPRWSRFGAILDHQIREQAGVLNILLLFFIFFAVVLPLVVTVYLRTLVPGALLGSTDLSTFYGPIGEGVWYILLALLVSSAGAAVVARDVSTKAMTLYLARPIRAIDYLGAKTSAVAFWVFLGGVLPGWVGTVILLALGYVPLLLALQAIGGYFVVGVFSVAAFTGLAVLLSSLTPRSTLAGAGTFGVLLGSYVIATVLFDVSGRTGFLYVSPVQDVLAVAQAVFGVTGGPLNPWSAAAILLGLALAALGLAYYRLLRNQVIAE